MSGENATVRRDKARHYLEMVGLSGFEDYLPARLSGGMRQRVSLARTLVMEPRLLLMDEPFAALDAITRETMNDELLRIWDELGQTVVFITHDMDEAIYLSDRILILDQPPGGVFREVKDDLPRPRNGTTVRSSERFWQYRKELMTHIAAVTKTRGVRRPEKPAPSNTADTPMEPQS
jgi:NitT/TauT family transport system ATP-binding protein